MSDVTETVWKESEILHIVQPAFKATEVFNGSKTWVKALCGFRVTKAESQKRAGAPVCRPCFNLVMEQPFEQAANSAIQDTPPL